MNGGINVVDLIHPDDRSRAVEQFELLMEDRKIQGAEYRLRKRDGTEMAGLLYASPLKKDGAVAGARMNITDITQRKRLEAQLQHAGKMETIVYSIIRKHNGHMHIDSKVGIGTTVEIYLPADASTISFRTLQDE